MKKTEKIIIAMVIAVICPVSLFFLLWWSSAALSVYHILPLSENSIGMVAISGLCLGIIMDILCLKKWTRTFYKTNTKLLMLAYVYWSAIAVALLMGLPFLNIALGIAAGLYVGRKQQHLGATRDSLLRATRNTSLFTAAVTGLEALPIGFLALRERTVQEALGSLRGLGHWLTLGPIGMATIIVLCLILMVIQFWCTRTAAMLAFQLGAAAPDHVRDKP